MRPDGRLFVVDRVIDSGTGDDRLVANLDIMMLASTGGRERTREDLSELIHSGGLRVLDQTLLKSGRCLTEAELARQRTS